MVERLTGGQEVVGSNPAIPIFIVRFHSNNFIQSLPQVLAGGFFGFCPLSIQSSIFTPVSTPSSPVQFRQHPLQWLSQRVRHPWRLLFLFAGILAPLGMMASLAEDIWKQETLHFDVPILLYLHAHSTPNLDRFFLLWTYAGGFAGTAIIVIVGGVWLWHNQRRRAFGFWLLTMLGVGILNVIIKLFFHRHRPTLWQPITPLHDYSFPSGHAMLSMSLGAAILLLLWPTRGQLGVFARWAAVIFAIIWPLGVGLSRLYLGVHFPSDVIAGWCAGLAWTVGVYIFWRGERDVYFQRSANDEAER